MNKKLLFFCIIFFVTTSSAMKRARIYKNDNKQPCKTRHLNASTEPTTASFNCCPLLPPDIQKRIIDFAANDTTEKKPKIATKTFNALSLTNKSFNALINDQIFSDKLINDFAKKFYCSHETIAKLLNTKRAKIRLNIQYELRALCCWESTINLTPQLKSLIAQGANLEFTYNHKYLYKTPLMFAATGNNGIFNYLLKKADINTSTSHGLTLLKFVTTYPIRPNILNPISPNILEKLLKHPDLNVNQQNKHGETALLCCLIQRPTISVTNMILLLTAGADPECANKYNLTPLMAAQNLGNQFIIDLIQDAIAEKHRYNNK
jgi:ankyrin repeat protein